MKRDIENREDLLLLVRLFYEKLLTDKLLHHFFEKFNQKEFLEDHLEVLVDFWDNVLFYSGTYQKNAMQPHLLLSREKPMVAAHFERWIFHFTKSVDELFDGNVAHAAKSRALSIATVMQIKVAQAQKK